jgi:hypothetical protein
MRRWYDCLTHCIAAWACKLWAICCKLMQLGPGEGWGAGEGETGTVCSPVVAACPHTVLRCVNLGAVANLLPPSAKSTVVAQVDAPACAGRQSCCAPCTWYVCLLLSNLCPHYLLLSHLCCVLHCVL